MMWTKAKIGDCCEITSSKRIFFSEYVESGIPFYRSKEIIELSNCQEISDPLYISESKYDEIAHKFGIPQPGDMLLTSVGTIGISYQVAAGKIDKDLLHRIIIAVMDGTYETDEELKLDIIHAIN